MNRSNNIPREIFKMNGFPVQDVQTCAILATLTIPCLRSSRFNRQSNLPIFKQIRILFRISQRFGSFWINLEATINFNKITLVNKTTKGGSTLMPKNVPTWMHSDIHKCWFKSFRLNLSQAKIHTNIYLVYWPIQWTLRGLLMEFQRHNIKSRVDDKNPTLLNTADKYTYKKLVGKTSENKKLQKSMKFTEKIVIWDLVTLFFCQHEISRTCTTILVLTYTGYEFKTIPCFFFLNFKS